MLHCLGQWLRLQHHALAAAKWPVVYGAMPVMGELAQIMHADAQQAALDRALDHAMLEDAGKETGKDGDDVEAHGHYSDSSPSVDRVFGQLLPLGQRSLHGQQAQRQLHLQPFGLDIHLPQVGPDKGYKHFLAARRAYHQHCRTRSFRLHIRDLACILGAAPAHIDDSHSQQIADIDGIAFERHTLFAGNHHFEAAQILRIGDRIDLGEFQHHASFVEPMGFHPGFAHSLEQAPRGGRRNSRLRSAKCSGKSVKISASTSP